LSVRRYVIKFSFEGCAFEGYARQPTGRTVEGELIRSLQRAKLIAGPDEAAFASASRVDRGVSALGAAAAFDTDAPVERVLRSLNAHTEELVAHSIAEVEAGFDPRRRASFRWYRYHYERVRPETGYDVDAMREAASLFIGEHDFSAFARLDGRDPRREVLDVTLEPRGGFLVLDVRGRSFLWNQVRRMASAVAMVGSGEVTVGDVASALGSGDGPVFRPAPPGGLFLMDVGYPDLEFIEAVEYPRGTMESLMDRYYRSRCKMRYLEYIQERVGF
jgi:tRNA pseudouridine38-40 synthase